MSFNSDIGVNWFTVQGHPKWFGLQMGKSQWTEWKASVNDFQDALKTRSFKPLVWDTFNHVSFVHADESQTKTELQNT